MKLSELYKYNLIISHDFWKLCVSMYNNFYYIRNNELEYYIKNNQIDNKIILCFGNDSQITQNIVNLFKSKNGKKLYSINLNAENDSNIKLLPIGIYQPYFKYIKQIFLTKNIQNNKKLLYLNFSTNFKPDRNLCRKQITSGLTEDQFLDECSEQSQMMNIEKLINYYNNISKHIFMACPCGSGFDCFRTYETLLLGGIPVMLKNRINLILSNEYKLPLLLLDKWDDFQFKWREFLEKFNNNSYNYEILSPIYWINEFNSIC